MYKWYCADCGTMYYRDQQPSYEYDIVNVACYSTKCGGEYRTFRPAEEFLNR